MFLDFSDAPNFVQYAQTWLFVSFALQWPLGKYIRVLSHSNHIWKCHSENRAGLQKKEERLLTLDQTLYDLMLNNWETLKAYDVWPSVSNGLCQCWFTVDNISWSTNDCCIHTFVIIQKFILDIIFMSAPHILFRTFSEVCNENVKAQYWSQYFSHNQTKRVIYPNI